MRYTESHEWVILEDNIATIGITDYAQKELGDIVYVELPHVGHNVSAGEEVVVVESTKAAVDIYSPLTGEITEINNSLKENPEKINKESETEGWLYKLRLGNLNEVNALLDLSSYEKLIRK